MICHWSKGQRTHNGRSRTQVNAVKSIHCPNFGELSDDKLNVASKFFTLVQSIPLRPACQAHVDEMRKRFDDLIFEILELPDEAKLAVDQLRNLWCNEPSVHGNNRQALKLLSNN